MKPLTLDAYWMGRDLSHGDELTKEISDNAAETVRRINLILDAYALRTGDTRQRSFNSGWRPPGVNAATPGAAKQSKHMLALAGDVSDADGSLDAWCISNDGKAALILHKLWMEHPSNTPGWTHFQTVPPRSGNLIFYAVAPSTRRPT